MPRNNQRSADARAYHAWYSTTRWKARRRAQLQAEPLCRMCRAAGRITPATVADHVKPHRGDPDLFWNGELQSLCDAKPWRCHSSIKQRQETGTLPPGVDQDGWPLHEAGAA